MIIWVRSYDEDHAHSQVGVNTDHIVMIEPTLLRRFLRVCLTGGEVIVTDIESAYELIDASQRRR